MKIIKKTKTYEIISISDHFLLFINKKNLNAE